MLARLEEAEAEQVRSAATPWALRDGPGSHSRAVLFASPCSALPSEDRQEFGREKRQERQGLLRLSCTPLAPGRMGQASSTPHQTIIRCGHVQPAFGHRTCKISL